jgi:flagellar biosynthetic protein FliR
VSDLINWFMVFGRAGALMVAFPLFSAQNVPVLLRLGLAGMTAFLLSPLLPAIPAVDPSIWLFIRLLAREIGCGLLLGFVCRFVFFALDLAGGLLSTEIGLMLSPSFNPFASTTTGPPAMILYWLAMMILLGFDMHHWILAAFKRSYDFLPVGGGAPSPALLSDIVTRSSGIFQIALQLCAPLMAVSFVLTLLFSLLSRVVPQMNVFAESLPIRVLAGMAAFGLTTNLMAQQILNYLLRLPEDMLHVAKLFGAR